jgi:hypothetical protein
MAGSVETFANETMPSTVASSSDKESSCAATCYKEFGKNWTIGLMCVVLRVERILNICNVPEKNLVSFPFHQYKFCLPALY